MKNKPRISQQLKEEIIQYAKLYNKNKASKKYNISYNTINFWINPEYKKYTLKKNYDNYDKILENSKKYSLLRRKSDMAYVAKRNKDAKKWQKEKRKNDPDWRKKNIEIATNYYNKTKHTENHLARCRKNSRIRRARKLLVNENYTKFDEAYTKQLFDNKCVICESTKNLNIDHWYPLSKGYPLTRNNATLMCFNCNKNKGNSLPYEFYNKDTFERITKLLN
jgi:hypothetical protein